MKKVVILTAAAVLLCSVQSFAQSFKFGHINMGELIQLMPERDSAVVKLENYAKDLDETMRSMQEEFQKKISGVSGEQCKLAACNIGGKGEGACRDAAASAAVQSECKYGVQQYAAAAFGACNAKGEGSCGKDRQGQRLYICVRSVGRQYNLFRCCKQYGYTSYGKV